MKDKFPSSDKDWVSICTPGKIGVGEGVMVGRNGRSRQGRNRGCCRQWRVGLPVGGSVVESTFLLEQEMRKNKGITQSNCIRFKAISNSLGYFIRIMDCMLSLTKSQI